MYLKFVIVHFVDLIQLEDCDSLVKADPGAAVTIIEPILYKCRSCRRIIGAQSNIISHTPPAQTRIQHSAYDVHNGILSDHKNTLENGADDMSTPPCRQLYFVEPIRWMAGVLQETNGKLHCPKCRTKIGGFSWDSGIACPCGEHVSPAFYLIPSKVELSRNRKR